VTKLWKTPPALKVIEALGAIADGRVRETAPGKATVVSSDGGKRYAVAWDPENAMVSSNDNASYWQGYLGYPAIAYLMTKGALPYDAGLAARLRGVEWKKLNTKLKKAEKVLAHLGQTGAVDSAAAQRFADEVRREIGARRLARPGRLPFPPKG
jgi:hypothetical protein